MNKKDIALSVGGVIATMVLAYLLYRMQKRDAAIAAQNAADASATSQATASDQFSYLSSLPSLSVQTQTIDTHASDGTDATAGFNDLLSEIISAFHDRNSTTPSNPYASLIIQPTTPETSVLQSVPVTAADAQAGVGGNTISVTPTAPVSTSTGDAGAIANVPIHPILPSSITS